MRLNKNLQNSSFEEPKIIEDTSVHKTSHYLDNYKISVVSGGGIAAVEIPRFIRELRRHGATTQIYMTENCLKFVGIESMRWASQNEVIINPSGLSEHICTSDVVVIAPATADLISKIKNGICCDAATTLVQSALGAKKIVIFCQTMHDSLANSPIILENKDYLKKLPNVFFVEPRKEEGKQKIPDVETLAMNICHIVNKQKKNIKEHILLTFGGTRVMLDPVRCITNLSTGALGIEVAKLFYGMGYTLTILAANTIHNLCNYGEDFYIHNLPEYSDLFDFASRIDPKKFDGLIHLVAASDFTPDKLEENKISSNTNKLTVTFSKTKKLLSLTKLQEISYKAAAKLTGGEVEEGLKQAKELITTYNLNAVFWNSAQDAWNNKKTHNGVFLENKNTIITQENVDSKKQIALCYFNSFVKFKG